jgi:hypothetical protein
MDTCWHMKISATRCEMTVGLESDLRPRHQIVNLTVCMPLTMPLFHPLISDSADVQLGHLAEMEAVDSQRDG